MEKNHSLDYQPQFKLKTKVDAPMPDAEVYENPQGKISVPLNTFINNKPSAVMQSAVLTIDALQDKIRELINGDHLVKAYKDMPSSLSRQVLYKNINDIEGNTNVILYDRLTKISDEMNDKIEMMVRCFFGEDLRFSEIQEIEQKIESVFINHELKGERNHINYEAINIDIKILFLIEQYIYNLIKESDVMIISNEHLEQNITPVQKSLVDLYEISHDKSVKDILDGKQVVDTNLKNDLIGNKLRNLYNLRTKLITLGNNLKEEEKETHSEVLAENQRELKKKIDEVSLDFFKSIESQRLAMAIFNDGYEEKCNILHSLKGGNQI